jgi:hypothetical protein
LPLHTNETYCPSSTAEGGKSNIIMSGLAEGPRKMLYTFIMCDHVIVILISTHLVLVTVL